MLLQGNRMLLRESNESKMSLRGTDENRTALQGSDGNTMPLLTGFNAPAGLLAWLRRSGRAGKCRWGAATLRWPP